jgi:hypothetical protein
MDYAPSHLYGHTVVKVLSFPLILPDILCKYRFRANESHDRLLSGVARRIAADSLDNALDLRSSPQANLALALCADRLLSGVARRIAADSLDNS